MASNFGKFTGNTIGEAAAFAAGVAIAPLLEPVVQELKNQTWSQAPDRPLDPTTVAEAVAEGILAMPKARDEAAMTGIAATPFGILADLARTAPGVSEALTLLRRNAIAPPEAQVTTDQLHLAYRKAKLDPQWWDALDALATVVLSPAQIALGMVRSVIDDQGLLVRKLDTADSNIPQYKPYAGDGVKEAHASGIDRERLRVLVGQIGLPMAVIAAAQAHFRGILTKGAYYQAVQEGDVRPEWADAYLDYSRQINTAHDHVELHLRGYTTRDQMYAGTALHGMSREDTDRLFLVLGRPLPVHQITTALARGGRFNPEPGELQDPYEASVHEANIKPSYYELAIANRYTYPSLFQLNNLVKASAITAEQAADWATKNGLAPEVVEAMLKFWRSEQGGVTSPGVRSATTRGLTAVSKAYIAARTSRATAEGELAKLGVDRATFDELFTKWDVTREATIAAMTNTQIRNAFRNLTITEADALARLVDRGLTVEQATAYLTARPGG